MVKRWEIGVKHLQNNVNHSSDTQGGEVTQGCPHTSKVKGDELLWSQHQNVISASGKKKKKQKEQILPRDLRFESGKKMRNRSQASSKQCESLLWYTRGRGYSRLPSYGSVQINKSSVVSGFPKQFESFGADSTANKHTTTEKYSTTSWRDLMFLSHIYIPKVPNIPVGQRESWLWLLSRKWERHNRYTQMHCGHKRGDFFYSGSSKYK